jgi:hypothetical protein
MSRSYKKPYHHLCCVGRKEIKFAKRYMTRHIRRQLNTMEEPMNGSSFKKIYHSWKWHPGDGKVYAPDYKKSRRK